MSIIKHDKLFAMISRNAIEDIQDWRALAVYVALVRFADFKKGADYVTGAWPSDKTIGKTLNMAVSTVKKGRREVKGARLARMGNARQEWQIKSV